MMHQIRSVTNLISVSFDGNKNPSLGNLFALPKCALSQEGLKWGFFGGVGKLLHKTSGGYSTENKIRMLIVRTLRLRLLPMYTANRNSTATGVLR
jgi:hypothetical protein